MNESTRLIDQARTAVKSGNDPEAIDIWKRILNQDSANENLRIAAFCNLTRLFLKQEEFTQAETWVLRGLEYYPDDLQLSLLHVSTAVQQDNWAVALQRIEPLRNDHPESLQAALQYSNCLFMLDRINEAATSYLQIRKNFPDCVPALAGCARVASRHQNHTQAMKYWREILVFDKTNFGALTGLANTSFSVGNFNEAYCYFERLAEAHPTKPHGNAGLARVSHRQQNWLRAIDHWTKAIDVNPNDISSHLNLLSCYLQLGEVGKAEVSLEHARLFFANDQRLLMASARLSLRNHDYLEANGKWTDIHDRFPNNINILFPYAQYLGQYGPRQRLKDVLDKVLRIDPGHKKAVLALAHYHILQQQGDVAKPILQAYLDTTPGHGGALFLLSKAEILCGNYLAAENTLKRVLKNEKDVQLTISALMQLLIAKIRVVDIAGFKNIDQQLDEIGSDPENKPLFEKNKSIIGQIREIFERFNTNPDALEALKQSISGETDQTSSAFLHRLLDVLNRYPDYFPAMQLLAQRLHQYKYFASYKGGSPGQSSSCDPQVDKFIPERIVQYWDTQTVPHEIQKAMKTWQNQYPGWQYDVYDDQKVMNFLEQYFDVSMVDCFRACYHPAMKSDFFRHTYLYHKGGFYVDADEVCIRKLEIPAEIHLVVRFQDQSSLAEFLPGFYAISPQHPMLSGLLDEMIHNVKMQTDNNHWFSVGPGLFTKHVIRHLTQNGVLENRNLRDNRPENLILMQSEYQTHAITPEFSYKQTKLNWLKSQHA